MTSSHRRPRLVLGLIGLIVAVVAVYVGLDKHVSAQATAISHAEKVQLFAAKVKLGIFKSQVANPLVAVRVAMKSDRLGVKHIGDAGMYDVAIIRNRNRSLAFAMLTNGHGNYNWDNRLRLIQIITRDAQAAYL